MTGASPDDRRLSPLRYLGIGAILIPFFVLFLFPFAIMISTSLKTNKEVYRQPPTLMPDGPSPMPKSRRECGANGSSASRSSLE